MPTSTGDELRDRYQRAYTEYQPPTLRAEDSDTDSLESFKTDVSALSDYRSTTTEPAMSTIMAAQNELKVQTTEQDFTEMMNDVDRP